MGGEQQITFKIQQEEGGGDQSINQMQTQPNKKTLRVMWGIQNRVNSRYVFKRNSQSFDKEIKFIFNSCTNHKSKKLNENLIWQTTCRTLGCHYFAEKNKNNPLLGSFTTTQSCQRQEQQRRTAPNKNNGSQSILGGAIGECLYPGCDDCRSSQSLVS